MKVLWISIAICAMVLVPSESLLFSESEHISTDLSKIYGNIQYVESFPDYEVEIVTSFPDLKVQIVDSFPDSEGKWKIVGSFPDFKIKRVQSFSDFKIEYVKSFPGVVK